MHKNLISVFTFLISTSAYAHEAQSFIEKYLKDLNKDADVSAYFVERPQFIFGHHIHISDSSNQASDYVRQLQKPNNGQDYPTSIIEDAKVLAKIEDYTLVTLTLNRVQADGKPLDKICSTYGILHLKFGYKILSWQPTKPDKHGKC